MDKEKFWNRIAAKYAKNPIKDMNAYEYTLGRTRSYLSKDDNVLELGCGTGSTALLLAEHVTHITATDLSSSMIDIAREKATAQKIANVEFIKMEVAGLGRSSDEFDVVMAFNLFHLLETPEKSIVELTACIKQGGLFISKTPCLAGKAWLFVPMIKVMQLFGKAPFVGFISVDRMDRIVENAGFEILEKEDYPNSPPNHYIVARKL